MSDKTATSLFMFSPLTNKYAGFYQGLLRGVASYQQLGNKLIQLGEQAHAFRQFDKVKEIALLLSNIPLKNFQAIGQYFLAVASNSIGNGDQEQARKLFEVAVDTAPTQYKSKALLSLAAVSINTGNFDSGFYYYNEAIKTTTLNHTRIEAMKGIAVLKAIEGYHNHSIKDLENMLPLIRYAQPHIYFDFLNSYAVELGEAGYKQEARNIIRHVLESPFAFAYPEWRETAEELKGANRSFAVIDPSPPNAAKLYSMPLAENREATKQDKPARIINLQQWKKKMGKDTEDEDNDKPKTTSDRLVKILQLVNSELTDNDLDKVIEVLEKLHSKKPKKP
jgi:hypothetical protein